MKWIVNLESPVAVYVQIENQVLAGVASGRIVDGDTLPSVRELAETLQVNPNTVTKAYRDLIMLGAIRATRGVGNVVTMKAIALAKRAVNEDAKRLLESVQYCLSCGVKVEEVLRVVNDAAKDAPA